MRVRPRSSAKNAWLLSPPSIVLLLSRPEMPRKEMRPNVPSGTAPGVRSAKLDQRRPLMGRLLIEVWLMFVEKSCCSVLMTGASLVTTTVSRSEEHTSELQSRQYLVCRLLLEKKKN